MVGVGKIPIEDAEIYLDGQKLEEAKVFVHIKGYSRARVTHIDVEHPSLKKVIPPRHSDYPLVKWSEEVEIPVKGHVIILKSKTIAQVLQNMNDNLYVGGKGKGIFFGFHKEQIRRLEVFGIERGVPPISSRSSS